MKRKENINRMQEINLKNIQGNAFLRCDTKISKIFSNTDRKTSKGKEVDWSTPLRNRQRPCLAKILRRCSK